MPPRPWKDWKKAGKHKEILEYPVFLIPLINTRNKKIKP